MLAPRRVGKTWLLGRLASDLAGSWAVISCDVEGKSTEQDFFELICANIESSVGIAGQAGGRLRQLWDNFKRRVVADGWQQALRTDWKAFAGTLVARLAEQSHPTVIMVDEIAHFVLALHKRTPSASSDFLHHLRALRQRHPQVRWLLTGCVGLDVVARQAGIAGALVDLQLFSLDPFDRTAALAYLDHLCAEREVLRPFSLDPEAAEKLLAELGWLSPYYLYHIAAEMRPTGAPCGPLGFPGASAADMDRAFAALLNANNRTYFAVWEEHLQKNLTPQDAARARSILAVCAMQAEGELLDTIFAALSTEFPGIQRAAMRELIGLLDAAGFVMRSGDAESPRHRFRSGLLRLYWRLHHAE
jgi:hypothetical protein